MPSKTGQSSPTLTATKVYLCLLPCLPFLTVLSVLYFIYHYCSVQFVRHFLRTCTSPSLYNYDTNFKYTNWHKLIRNDRNINYTMIIKWKSKTKSYILTLKLAYLFSPPTHPLIKYKDLKKKKKEISMKRLHYLLKWSDCDYCPKKM